MACHQDARYIPPRRKGDSSRRRWRNNFVVRWFVPAAFMIVAVALVVFTLIFWREQLNIQMSNVLASRNDTVS
jgi:hypothetical protein